MFKTRFEQKYKEKMITFLIFLNSQAVDCQCDLL